MQFSETTSSFSKTATAVKEGRFDSCMVKLICFSMCIASTSIPIMVIGILSSHGYFDNVAQLVGNFPTTAPIDDPPHETDFHLRLNNGTVVAEFEYPFLHEPKVVVRVVRGMPGAWSRAWCRGAVTAGIVFSVAVLVLLLRRGAHEAVNFHHRRGLVADGWEPVELLCAVSIAQKLKTGGWRCGLSGAPARHIDKKDLKSKPECSTARAWRRPASNELLLQVSPDNAFKSLELLALRDTQPTAVGERDACVPLATDPTGDVELCFLYLYFEAPAPRDAFMLAYSPL